MADDNQNNQEHSTSSFKDQILRSLRGEDEMNEENTYSVEQQIEKKNDPYKEMNPEMSRTYTPDEKAKEGKQDEQVSVGVRSENKQINGEESFESRRDNSLNNQTTSGKETTKQTRKQEDRIVSKIVLIVASVLLLVIAIFGFTFYKYVNAGLKPLDTTDTKLVQVYIPENSSNKKIATILEDSKVIKSAMVFNYYAKFKNLSEFQAGYYQMAPSMTLDEIGAMLREGGTAEPTQIADAKVTIPEGYSIDKIGDAIEEHTSFKKADFIKLMNNEDFFNKMNQTYPKLLSSAATAQGVRYRLEGYLFPATYNYYDTMTLEEFVEQMITKMSSVMETYIPLLTSKGMTVQQTLTLASLVEKEGVKEDDRKKIAQVFFNRIAANMPLQSDISILYALGEHKELVTLADLEVDSPYNLYKNTGYGPGPMDSPSEQAINAVLNPIANNYLYFVADISTGNVYFSETYEEHQELVAKYVNNSDTKETN